MALIRQHFCIHGYYRPNQNNKNKNINIMLPIKALDIQYFSMFGQSNSGSYLFCSLLIKCSNNENVLYISCCV